MFIAIPIFIIMFFIYGMLDTWGLAIVPIIVALLFTNNIALVMISASVILSQILTWMLRMHRQAGAMEPSFIVRFGILLIVLRLAFYINQVYVARLKENTFIAYHDFMTKLPNRRFFNEYLERTISVKNAAKKQVGVLVMNVDHFKLVNDVLGHDGGDAFLKMIGNTVEQIITKENFVAYFGGDTFLAVVNDSNDKRMEELLKKINERLKNSWVIDGQEFKISMSIGAAVYPVDGKDTGSLLKNADLAMYKAKENGGAQTYICSQAMREEVEKKQIITNYLYKAIERKEIYLVFQPKVNASSEKIEAVEALVRWNNKEIGMIPPAVFIPLAERTGIINQIGEWVFEEACRQSRRWKEMGKKLIPIAVNVSGYQLQDVKIISKMKHIILENMVDPKFIEIEVTESIAMNLAGDVSELLFQLKKIGISIAIDDFGTGYSSLSRLNELPIDVLKIDKKFVDGILKSDRERAMIKTIIDLAKNLNLKIVAEGAETKEQVDFLKQKQCDFIQGYYYFKPLSVEELNTYL